MKPIWTVGFAHYLYLDHICSSVKLSNLLIESQLFTVVVIVLITLTRKMPIY